ncbi:MAG: DUF2281 domain-containing protein [Deltaproteobacteria bacterium]|nr:DUF2281 domain-containing protein [Deltaproteobacteria bacterium]
MTLAEKIVHKLEKLPKPAQAEVLDFVEFLKAKRKSGFAGGGDAWSDFSLANAMSGMEAESFPEYALADLKEKFS